MSRQKFEPETTRRKNVLEKTPLEPLSYSSMGRQELYYNLVLQNDKHSPRWVLQFEKFLHVEAALTGYVLFVTTHIRSNCLFLCS
jgi:hypothetical protein